MSEVNALFVSFVSIPFAMERSGSAKRIEQRKKKSGSERKREKRKCVLFNFNKTRAPLVFIELNLTHFSYISTLQKISYNMKRVPCLV